VKLGSQTAKMTLKKSLITESPPLQICSIFRHKKFGSLRKSFHPTFNVRLESLLHFMSSNTTNCLIELWGNGTVEEKGKA